MMKRILGAFMLLMGVALACWIGYNLFVERQPEARRSPLMGIVFCIALLYVGGMWVRGKTAG